MHNICKISPKSLDTSRQTTAVTAKPSSSTSNFPGGLTPAPRGPCLWQVRPAGPRHACDGSAFRTHRPFNFRRVPQAERPHRQLRRRWGNVGNKVEQPNQKPLKKYESNSYKQSQKRLDGAGE